MSLQPTVCKNPNCVNRRRFLLDVNQSRFVDFQKVRIQETQQELPRGSIPRRYVLERDEKEGRKKQARSNKQQSKVTQHTQGSHFLNELPRVGFEPTCTCTCTSIAHVHIPFHLPPQSGYYSACRDSGDGAGWGQV